jgi:hypothetical protein
LQSLTGIFVKFFVVNVNVSSLSREIKKKKRSQPMFRRALKSVGIPRRLRTPNTAVALVLPCRHLTFAEAARIRRDAAAKTAKELPSEPGVKASVLATPASPAGLSVDLRETALRVLQDYVPRRWIHMQRLVNALPLAAKRGVLQHRSVVLWLREFPTEFELGTEVSGQQVRAAATSTASEKTFDKAALTYSHVAPSELTKDPSRSTSSSASAADDDGALADPDDVVFAPELDIARDVASIPIASASAIVNRANGIVDSDSLCRSIRRFGEWRRGHLLLSDGTLALSEAQLAFLQRAHQNSVEKLLSSPTAALYGLNVNYTNQLPYIELLPYLSGKARISYTYCSVCDVEVPDTNLSDHLQTTNHSREIFAPPPSAPRRSRATGDPDHGAG